ncbi:MAG: DUF4157 domain-containing protein, partial [Oscillospiraceae bacterium]|nr:DUF4157 domain-containing protein [Oscillospiraceae bacterium]
MKAGFERSSGFSFDDVKVHYNSEKPAQLRAHAYTQGNNVYVAPGQEKHLPHELGHVVQQKSDMVEANSEIEGLPLNDDEAMENDADEKAEEAEDSSDSEDKPLQAKFKEGGVVQREKESASTYAYNVSAGPVTTAFGILGMIGGIGSFLYTKHADRKHRYIEEIEKYADAACDACDEQIAAMDMYNAQNNGNEEKNKAHAEAIKNQRKVRSNYEAAIKKAATMSKGKIGNRSLRSFNSQVLRQNDIEDIKDPNVKDALNRAYVAYQESILPANNPLQAAAQGNANQQQQQQLGG